MSFLSTFWHICHNNPNEKDDCLEPEQKDSAFWMAIQGQTNQLYPKIRETVKNVAPRNTAAPVTIKMSVSQITTVHTKILLETY
jgi:hypothetical protein